MIRQSRISYPNPSQVRVATSIYQEADIIAARDERFQVCVRVPLNWQQVLSRGKVAEHFGVPTVDYWHLTAPANKL